MEVVVESTLGQAHRPPKTRLHSRVISKLIGYLGYASHWGNFSNLHPCKR